MKKFLLIGCCFFLYGCQTVPVAPTALSEPTAMQRRFISLSQLRTGLSRQDVNGLLGKEVITGYTLSDEESGEYAPVTVANPYRSETVLKDKKTYLVDYYLVGIKTADDKVSDDELIPVVFLNDKVAGFGWAFFNQRVKGQ